MTRYSILFTLAYIFGIEVGLLFEVYHMNIAQEYKIVCYLMLILLYLGLLYTTILYTRITDDQRVEYDFRTRTVQEYGEVTERKDIENKDNAKILAHLLEENRYTKNQQDRKTSLAQEKGRIDS